MREEAFIAPIVFLSCLTDPDRQYIYSQKTASVGMHRRICSMVRNNHCKAQGKNAMSGSYNPSPLRPVYHFPVPVVKPILLAYSSSSSFFNPSRCQFPELVRLLNLPFCALNSSSIDNGRIGPKSSSGFLLACAASAARSSGLSAH